MRKVLKCGLACAPMLLGAALMIFGCDQEWPGGPWDIGVDSQPDIVLDTGFDSPPDAPPDTAVDPGTDPGTDPGVDPGTDPGVDPGTDPGIDTSGCTYPAGPYAYTRIGDTVGPASWPLAIQASGETFPSPDADFEDFYCDEGVESIVIMLSTLS